MVMVVKAAFEAMLKVEDIIEAEVEVRVCRLLFELSKNVPIEANPFMVRLWMTWLLEKLKVPTMVAQPTFRVFGKLLLVTLKSVVTVRAAVMVKLVSELLVMVAVESTSRRAVRSRELMVFDCILIVPISVMAGMDSVDSDGLF
jgi:hypothetical protein